MANYKNMRGRSYAQQRRSSSGSILKTLGIVLVAFLVIGLLGSLFSRSYVSADTDKNNSIEEVELIRFTYCGKTYHCEAGMTWFEFVHSNYNTDVFFHMSQNSDSINDINGDLVCVVGGNEVFGSDEIIADYGYISG